MNWWKRLFGGGNPSEPPPPEPASLANPPSPPEESDGTVPARAAALVGAARPSSARDRAVRVFVSSTFRDMIEDRNELMAQVWPALRRLCRARGVEFVEVDLRWGVTEEQGRRKQTVRHCLAEIKRCRPYFIGLLGERYGWMPGPEAYPQALLEEEAWLKDELAMRSLTELEILHGVLNNPDMAERAYFYFRNPKYAEIRGGDYLPEGPAQRDRQATLKRRVREVCEAKNIALREDYSDPHALAGLVLADLTAAIDAEFPPGQTPDVWAREDRDHEAYARSRRTDFYISRDAYYERLDKYAREGAGGRGLTVLGVSGGGKSALLANWTARRRQANPGDFVFEHYIGSSPISAGHLALMRRLMAAVIRWCRDESAQPGLEQLEDRIPVEAQEIVKAFPGYLDRLALRAKEKSCGAILVFDALNQLEDRERGRLLAWLPYRLPAELRLIVSTLPGDTLEGLNPRGWPELTVEPLTAEERVRLIALYLAHFSQALSAARARRIADAGEASNPLYIKTLLDDLRATGDHKRLGAQIKDYLQAKDTAALLGKILTRYERDYQRDHPGLVREALSLLWAARRGLTEPELLELLKPADQRSLPAALWSPVRCALENGLLDRDGVLAFAHEHLRTAVERKYAGDSETVRMLRVRLADYFASQPIDARQADELPWLLRLGERRDRLRACLLDIDRFLLIQQRDEDELLSYWVWLNEQRAMGGPYVAAFEAWADGKGKTRKVTQAATWVSNLLLRAGSHVEAEFLMRLALQIDEQICGKGHQDVALDLNNLAQLLRETNRLAEAESLFRRALEIVEQLRENRSDLAVFLNNLAALLSETGQFREAERLLGRALELEERIYGENHPNVARCLTNLAVLYEAVARLPEAERLLRRALSVDTASYGQNHSAVATILNNLGVLLRGAGRCAEAESLLRRALDIDERTYGSSHTAVARDLSNLAGVLQDTNRCIEAERLRRRAVEISEACFGGLHPEVATQLNNLAGLLQATNRLAEAEPMLRRALEIDEQTYRKSHPNVSRDLNNLAVLLLATGRFADAELLMRNALGTCETALGKEHPRVAAQLNNLAQVLKATGRSGEAEPMMRRALALDERIYGGNHPRFGRGLSNLAELLRTTQRPVEAEPLIRRAVAILETSLGPEHPDVATALNNLALLLQDTGRLAEAEIPMRRALSIDENSYGPNHPAVAIDCNNLAQLLQDSGRLPEAEPLSRRAVEIFLTFNLETGHPHPQLRGVVSNHEALLQRMGHLPADARDTLIRMARRHGVDLGEQGSREDEEPSPGGRRTPASAGGELDIVEEFTLPNSIGALLPSPDSTRLAFIAADRAGMHVEVSGIVVGQLGYEEVAGLTFSADSRHIAFAARRGSTWTVVLDGKESPGWDGVGVTSPVIVPDSTTCVYAAQRRGKWYVVLGATVHGPYEEIGAGGIAISPDSARCAYVINQSGAYVVTVDGRPGPVFHGVTRASLVFSPDSKRLAYVAAITPGEAAVVIDHQPQKVWPTGKGSGLSEQIFFSPDSRRLAYLVGQAGEWFAVIDGAQEKRYATVLARSPQSPPASVSLGQSGGSTRRRNNFTFSPDSLHYAYGVADGADNVVVYDGTEKRRHRHPDGILDASLLFSPSSRHLAYAGQKSNNTCQFLVIDFRDAQEFPGLAMIEACFSSDSGNIAYVTTSGDRFTLVVDSVDASGCWTRSTKFLFPSPPQPDAPLRWNGSEVQILTREGRKVRLVKFAF